jgi:hypothetical protein
MTTHRSHNPSARWTWCRRCKQRGYFLRSDAKTVRKRLYTTRGLAVFPCPHNNDLYHVGQRPTALSRGIITRRQLRRQAGQNPPDDGRQPPHPRNTPSS